jgi:uncharacterized protein
VIVFDTNVLVYAHRADSPFHERARAVLREHAEGPASWAIPWPCLHEFLAVTTSPRVFRDPTPPDLARRQVDAVLASPSLHVLAEGPGYWEVLRALLEESQVRGPKVHDARIAALALFHRAKILYSADRDFSRFPRLPVTNPLA